MFHLSPLTEEDEEPHDEGQAREDQASFADGFIVLGEKRHAQWYRHGPSQTSQSPPTSSPMVLRADSRDPGLETNCRSRRGSVGGTGLPYSKGFSVTLALPPEKRGRGGMSKKSQPQSSENCRLLTMPSRAQKGKEGLGKSGPGTRRAVGTP